MVPGASVGGKLSFKKKENLFVSISYMSIPENLSTKMFRLILHDVLIAVFYAHKKRLRLNLDTQSCPAVILVNR